MAITLWKAWRPFIAKHLRQCPTFEIDDASKEIAREFCRESRCWRAYGLTLLTTVSGQASYTFSALPDEAEIYRVQEAWDGECELDVALPGERADQYPGKTDSRWRIEAVPPTSLLLSPAPNASSVVIKGALSFIPTTAATGLLSTIFDEHRYALASGAVAMLAAQPDKPWSNPAIVSYHQGKFEAGVAKASYDAGPVQRRPLRVKQW